MPPCVQEESNDIFIPVYDEMLPLYIRGTSSLLLFTLCSCSKSLTRDKQC
jgi:hypothetical protein